MSTAIRPSCRRSARGALPPGPDETPPPRKLAKPAYDADTRIRMSTTYDPNKVKLPEAADPKPEQRRSDPGDPAAVRTDDASGGGQAGQAGQAGR